jgi:hypothetical protein
MIVQPLMVAMLVRAIVFGVGEAASDEAFDGRWSLQVTTEQGVCRSYGDLPIRVSSGAIRHAGLGGLLGTVGRVESDGNVRFEMRQRGHVVTASGVMTEEVGGGRWVSTRGCTGHWQASR